uniref:SBP-type domain-containing protein n=1 Tax=Leersia perrieri TaxID=77586 RepID=A0A0D9XFE9_9ORYZ
MDWDLKMPVSWDLTDLDHDAVPATPATNTTTALGIASAAVAPAGRPECSVDLKLGGLGEFGAAAKGPAVVPPSNTSPASPAATAVARVPTAAASPARRPRGVSGAGQCPSCAVDGCKADLSKYRDYHRRHKVCEPHSKTPVVVVSGREMRFCQQCSRFHLLGEFDEIKRSCRKRLDGHNRRRRKPQADSMSASFMTSQQGTRFASFTPPRPEPSWSGIIKSEETPYYSHHHHHHHHQIMSSGKQHFVGSPSRTTTTTTTATFSSSSSKEAAGRRFPFLHDGDQISLLKTTTAVVSPVPATAIESSSSNNNKIFSDGQLGHTHHQILDSDCALSLLSSPANSSTVDVAGRINLHHHPPHHPSPAAIPIAQSLVPNLQQQFGGGGGSSPWFASGGGGGGFNCPTSVESEQQQVNTAVVPGSNENEMNYHGIFHVAGEGSSDGTSPSIPFSWQ